MPTPRMVWSLIAALVLAATSAVPVVPLITARADQPTPMPTTPMPTTPMLTTPTTTTPTITTPTITTPTTTTPTASMTASTPLTLTLSASVDTYTLNLLLAQRYAAAQPGLQIVVNPTDGQAAFDDACAGGSQLGARDVYIQDSELARPGCADMINIPIAAQPVAVVYNLPGARFTTRTADGFTLAHPVRLTPRALAGIYLGRVTRWNDAAIAALNPGLTLPAARIRPFCGANLQGLWPIVDQWLSLSDGGWRASGGFAHQRLAACVASRPDAGLMAQSVKATPYSVGFVDFDYAIALRLQAAALRNAAGVFRTPSLNGVRAAIAGAIDRGMRSDFRQSFVGAAGRDAYDPSYFVFFLTHRDLRPHSADPALRQAVKAFLQWSVSDHGGQQYIGQIAGLPIAGPRCEGYCAPAVLPAVIRALVASIVV